MRYRVRFLHILIGLAPIAGCSGQPDDRPTLTPVTGIVTWEGDPLSDADVSFTPDSGGRPAYGRTDLDGKFQLTTFDPNDGASLGEHVVTVRAEFARDNVDPNNPYQQIESLIPTKYAEIKTTPLRVEVIDGGPEITIELDK